MRDRHHLELARRGRATPASTGPPLGPEDEVDEHVAVVGLQQPVLERRPPARRPASRERLLRARSASLGQDEEVDVVLGLRAAARPDGEPARERVRDAGVAQGGSALAHRLEQVVEAGVGVGHGAATVPAPARANPC